jgi:hypothetical protein
LRRPVELKLPALIGVMNQLARWLPAADGHLDRVDHELGLHV